MDPLSEKLDLILPSLSLRGEYETRDGDVK